MSREENVIKLLAKLKLYLELFPYILNGLFYLWVLYTIIGVVISYFIGYIYNNFERNYHDSEIRIQGA